MREQMNVLHRRYIPSATALFVFGAFLQVQCASGAPSITQQPSPATNSVSLGVSLTNRIIASSPLGPVSFQWRLNSVDVSGATNSTLILTNIRSAQEGRYT